MQTYSLFNFKEFSDKLTGLIDFHLNNSYEKSQIASYHVQQDKQTIAKESTQSWFQSVLIDMKKNVSMMKSAEITLIEKNDLMQKIAYNPKYLVLFDIV